MTQRELSWVNFGFGFIVGLYLLIAGSHIPAFFLGALAGMNGAWLISDYRKH